MHFSIGLGSELLLIGGNYSVAAIFVLLQMQLQLFDNLLSMYVIIETNTAVMVIFFPLKFHCQFHSCTVTECEVMAVTFLQLFVFCNVFYFNKNQDIVLHILFVYMSLVFIR